jgi:pre-mRNA-processing factor SLU7
VGLQVLSLFCQGRVCGFCIILCTMRFFLQNSYCLGEAGRNSVTPVVEVAASEPEKETEEKESSDSSSESSSDAEVKSKAKNKKKNKKKKQKEKKKQKRIEEKDKLKEALKAEEDHQNKAERLLALDERKRPYNSMFEVKKPTEEEIEAYYLKRRREEDPMNQFMN